MLPILIIFEPPSGEYLTVTTYSLPEVIVVPVCLVDIAALGAINSHFHRNSNDKEYLRVQLGAVIDQMTTDLVC